MIIVAARNRETKKLFGFFWAPNGEGIAFDGLHPSGELLDSLLEEKGWKPFDYFDVGHGMLAQIKRELGEDTAPATRRKAKETAAE